MIKFEIDSEQHIQYLECRGGHKTLAADVAMLMCAIYAQTRALDPRDGEILKNCFQINVSDDSPIWDPPKEWARVSPERSVTSVILPRRDDG